MMDKKVIKREQVFLVQGREVDQNGMPTGTMHQKVVVAEDDGALRGFLVSQAGTSFDPVGWASLKDYEDAVSLIRTALAGQGDLPVVSVSK